MKITDATLAPGDLPRANPCVAMVGSRNHAMYEAPSVSVNLLIEPHIAGIIRTPATYRHQCWYRVQYDGSLHAFG